MVALCGRYSRIYQFRQQKKAFFSRIEINLYRIVQEALTTYKHAKARRAEVMLDKRNDLIVLIMKMTALVLTLNIRESEQRIRLNRNAGASGHSSAEA
jgi:signal transduction histidine kinase